MQVDLLQQLCCPGGGPALRPATITKKTDDEIQTGSVLCPRGGLYAITDGILDLRPEHVGPLSIAQRSNLLALTSLIYEPLWRVRSLSLLSGEHFPIVRELRLMLETLGAPRSGLWLDLGCSTGLYGRTVAKHVFDAGGRVIMLDLSMTMLRNAGMRARSAGLSNVGLVCGRGERLPFANGSVQGLVCGGSLNEFGAHGVDAVLREVARTLAPTAPSFWMYLLEAHDGIGRVAQAGMRRTGIQFWRPAEVEALFARAGLRIETIERSGVVAFARAVRG